jgi:hypothetical protein
MRNHRILALLVLLTGCGGGSDGDSVDTRFFGDYVSSWATAQTEEQTARADLRRVHADGWGTYATDFEPDAQFDERVPYTLAADGALNGLTGIVDPEGALFLEGDLDPADSRIGFGIGVRLDRDANQRVISGEYLSCAMSFETVGDGLATDLSRIVVNGLSALDSEILAHSNGATGSKSRLFSVLEGYLVIEGGPVGGVNLDGSVFATADQNGVSGETSIRIAIRKSTSATDAVCLGSYVGFGLFATGSGVVTRRAVFDADGEGEIRITHAGSDGIDGFRAGSYTVSEDGSLEIDDGHTGVIRADGGIFALVDTDAADGQVSIWIGVRRS